MDATLDKHRIVYFCSLCFADSEGGSWGECAQHENCYNCGSTSYGQGMLLIPKYIVENIRKNASWIGKRYYSHQEDDEIRDELRVLRNKIGVFPGRHAIKESTNKYLVIQQLSSSSHQMMFVDAESEEEALEKTKDKLPYRNLNNELILQSLITKESYERVFKDETDGKLCLDGN